MAKQYWQFDYDYWEGSDRSGSIIIAAPGHFDERAIVEYLFQHRDDAEIRESGIFYYVQDNLDYCDTYATKELNVDVILDMLDMLDDTESEMMYSISLSAVNVLELN